MLKGHVFKRQVFGNQIFALFIDTFLNGKCGISDRYGEKMQVTYNGSTLYVNSGCACIKGRFLEEDTNTEIVAGTENAFCKLVIEIDLDKENTDENLLQATYKVVKSTSNYPSLTQTDIVRNNSGVYQFELAQFKTTASGITDFVDRRSYLDFNSIYSKIQNEYREVLLQLEKELQNVENGSAYLLKTKIIKEKGTNLNDYKEDGKYYFGVSYTPTNIPTGMNGWLEVITEDKKEYVKQIWYRHGTANNNDYETYVRTYTSETWSDWKQYATIDGNIATATSASKCTGNSATATKLATARNIALSGAVKGNANFDGSGNITITTTQTNIFVLTGNITLNSNTSDNALNNRCTYTDFSINYPNGLNKDNCILIGYGKQNNSNFGYAYGWDNYIDSMDSLIGILPMRINLYGSSTTQYANKIRIQIGNLSTNSVAITYKILLMKVS